MSNEQKFPTEIVDLPSKGLLYPTDSPLSSGKIESNDMFTFTEEREGRGKTQGMRTNVTVNLDDTQLAELISFVNDLKQPYNEYVTTIKSQTSNMSRVPPKTVTFSEYRNNAVAKKYNIPDYKWTRAKPVNISNAQLALNALLEKIKINPYTN